jgi:hypothetical protein
MCYHQFWKIALVKDIPFRLSIRQNLKMDKMYLVRNIRMYQKQRLWFQSCTPVEFVMIHCTGNMWLHDRVGMIYLRFSCKHQGIVIGLWCTRMIAWWSGWSKTAQFFKRLFTFLWWFNCKWMFKFQLERSSRYSFVLWYRQLSISHWC